MRSNLARLLNTSDAKFIEEALTTYRKHYRENGIFESELYPKIVDVLIRLTTADQNSFLRLLK